MEKIFIDFEKIFNNSNVLLIINSKKPFRTNPIIIENKYDLLYVYDKLRHYNKLEEIILSYPDPDNNTIPLINRCNIRKILYNDKIELDLNNKIYKKIIFEGKLNNNCNKTLDIIIKSITNH